MPIFRVLFCVLIVSLSLGAFAAQPGEIGGGDHFKRLKPIRMYDFEEYKAGNFETMPRDWYIMGRPPMTNDARFNDVPLHAKLKVISGFTIHSTVRFDPKQSPRNKNHSLYLKINRDNAGAFLGIGALPVVPGSDYRIGFRVKTRGLKRSHAIVRVYYVDRDKKIIGQSEDVTAKIQTKGQWHEYSLRLSGNYDQATYIGMQVEIIQPVFDPKSPLGKHQLVLKDLEGEAWFDDITVWQLPSVDVSTQSDVNIIRDPDKPMLTVSVRDLSGNPMRTKVSIYDAAMTRVAYREEPAGDGAPSSWKWGLDLKKYGWYMVDMSIHEAGGENKTPLARTLRTFLWLGKGDALVVPELNKFQIILEGLDNRGMKLIPEFAKQSQISSFLVSAWSEKTTIAGMPQRLTSLGEMFAGLTRDGRHAQVSLFPMPTQLVSLARRRESDVLGVFSKKMDLWVGYLLPIIMRQGQNVEQWQVGSFDFVDEVITAGLTERLGKFSKNFTNLAPHPSLVLPWSLHASRVDMGSLDVIYHLDLPVHVAPESIKEMLGGWQGEKAPRSILHLNLLDARRYSHVDRGIDLAFRMLYAWQAGAKSLSMSKPFVQIRKNSGDRLLPDAALGVYTHMAQLLRGRNFVTWLKFKPGIKCMVFDGRSSGMMAIWSEDAAIEDRKIQLYLGENVKAFDVNGNPVAIELKGHQHQIKIGSAPIFLTGIDTHLAVFRSRFKLDQPFILSHQIKHGRMLEIYNPWDRTISGTLRMTDPKKWTIKPEMTEFFIAAGETYRLPVTVRFPRSETAGKKMLGAAVEFVVKNQYKIKLQTQVEIGLKDIEMDVNLLLEPSKQGGSDDALVIMIVSNKGKKPISMYGFASLKTYAMLQKPIQNLQPGQKMTKIFRFKNAGEVLKKFKIRAGIREINGPATLSKRVGYEGE